MKPDHQQSSLDLQVICCGQYRVIVSGVHRREQVARLVQEVAQGLCCHALLIPEFRAQLRLP